MECERCGHENRAGAAFCEQCGAALKLTCPHCGADARTEAKFCDSCGKPLEAEKVAAGPDPLSYTPAHLADRILEGREAIQGERRTVTVLFTDAAGFTPISERLDEEEVYRLMQGCLQRMMDAVHHFEGTVVQFRGDGVMALFGAPIAHEDSAGRAVAAGLEMQRTLGQYGDELKKRLQIDCRFRVGLNTGPVVVGSISEKLEMDFTALGDTVNLAARMEQSAELGTVYLTANTYRAVADYFDCESVGDLQVKGKRDAVAAYRAVGAKEVRTRLEAAAARGLSPFVGRDQEMATLEGYLKRASDGRGQVVFVAGEAGIGKSRLLLEFRRRAETMGVAWIEGQCVSYGRNIPYLPMVDLLKDAFGIEEQDAEERIIARLDEQTASWNRDAQGTVPFLRLLLNVDAGDDAAKRTDAMGRRAGIYAGLRALVAEESAGQGLVVLVEDVHWIDQESEAALGTLVDFVASLPVLLVLSHRPGVTPGLGERSYYSRLVLDDLPPDESASVAAGVLGSDSLPNDVRDLILNKAEGNPFTWKK